MNPTDFFRAGQDAAITVAFLSGVLFFPWGMKLWLANRREMQQLELDRQREQNEFNAAERDKDRAFRLSEMGHAATERDKDRLARHADRDTFQKAIAEIYEENVKSHASKDAIFRDSLDKVTQHCEREISRMVDSFARRE